jgi:hypothetical protein
MSGKAVLERFVLNNPLTVMTRCIIEAVIGDGLDEVFEQNRQRQYHDTITFSTLAMSMADIAIGAVKNRNQAYAKYRKELQTSVIAYYQKINRTEPRVSEAVVRHSAERASRLIDQLGFCPWQVLPGYRCVSLDGNHLRKTEKRLKETRGLCAAPLPGTIVARFDHQTGLFDRAYLLEDAHAQESSVLDRAVEDLARRDLVIADRHFCIVGFFHDVDARHACFLVRQHGRLKGELCGKQEYIGRIETGSVYEQALRIDRGDDALVVRRITVMLDQPTRDGDTEIHVLSNVPASDATACKLAEMYHQRWEIENAFHVLTMTLTCEMKSNCHPRCALLLFCMAILAYNCRLVLLAGLYAEHAEEAVDQMSHYQVALNTIGPMEGMQTAITPQEWQLLIPRDSAGQAAFLREVAQHVNVRSYRKSVRGPKRPPPKRKRCKTGTHVSAHRLLQKRKQTR